ncbi:phosphoribosylformylglycinamidine synthase subunit PurQ [Gloeobacter violaceus]|uniref:Phosphoribosylformylglycinamidine synthase subunit PurQ n=1 Tax=Gloeobacter violaceus (strain ATCC 29082 / PCC 7421) TaxID=251221 RepID=PURQ_GLOVI|nr:phosphoribosylformylglycinamidine synthase subunit PurQ [Gloeobacter violaceus]Q7NL01.1 RecName: Full=Phosphoribosylformylglycinamidine synthase subunit PurQ; Short=FGAM synthase; AltName: Full=Formylglycinamide ribonucleotide amidotransferase subunit I; Short=FGAR amidotransferase I; Short=FGAR-AT I; AltName: Full=Glutaminase PurQ; AltName: Full=Phosphoribosylformylglycinamidine synthase subunit I [Gloeobacter violaceus PCC 7421]BAC89266.1 phosphoribosylformyl glycinamidine synthetase [Gloeob
MKFAVIVFPGSNCDRDVVTVTRGLLDQPTRLVWHTEDDLDGCDVAVIPGGFSYGDYLRCGAIARFSPVMQAVRRHAERGGLVIGICNGFQVLTEAGLLPGALVRNRDLQFVCDRVALKVERTDLPWVHSYRPGEVITLPIAHGEGCYYAEEATLAELEENRQVVFRYCRPDGTIDAVGNPNGSLHNIAGLCNRHGNVLGMMPHPERASDPILGGSDGRRLFESLVASALAVV